MRTLKNKKNRSLGQTALEYALVLAVVAIGIVLVAKGAFLDSGLTKNLMEGAIKNAGVSAGVGELDGR